MNLLSLYEDMKSALAFLGLHWGEMHMVHVSMNDEGLLLSFGTKEVRIGVPRK